VNNDRDAALKRAAKLLRQGKLEAAIAEYVRVTTAVPGDTSSVNALGDLYVRAGEIDRAVAQFARAGEQLAREGASERAAAVYKKILRIRPGDKDATLALERLGGKGKRARRKGAPAMAPADPESRMIAAREAQDAADAGRACALLIEAAELYEAQGRHADALAAVAEASSIDPANAEYRTRMLKTLIAQGELVQARCVARIPSELAMVAQAFQAAGRPKEAAETIAEATLADPEDLPPSAPPPTTAPPPAEATGDSKALDVVIGDEADADFARVDAAIDAAAAAGDWENAVSVLEGFVARVPHHVPALLRLIEVCIEAGWTDRMSAAQEHLADAYLHRGRGIEARLIAEDLVMRAPWESARVERLLRALVLCHDPDPEQTIANLLCSDGTYLHEGL
jgi:tetratricopeptide (TPR) repeat protein